MNRSRVLKAVLVVIFVIVALGVAGFLWYAQPQPLLPEATAALASTDRATFQDQGGTLVYTPTAEPPTTGLILYPGGKVPPAAYAPAARAIAEAGYLTAIVDVPFNLAVFDIDAAQAVIDAHPEVTTWVVGGHSLGGSMAAQFAASHPGAVDGLVFWASYSAADLASEELAVASIYGSLDGGVPSFTDPVNLAKLGNEVTTTLIDGGNHEQMGWYTGQPNDPPATIPRAEQQRQLVEATVAFLADLARP